jgi:hypothetical protein
VTSIEFFSCETAAGDAGSQFLKDFAASLGSASGFTVPVTAAKTYWDLNAGGRRVTEVAPVPEPASILLLFGGLAATAHRFHRSSRQNRSNTSPTGN